MKIPKCVLSDAGKSVLRLKKGHLWNKTGLKTWDSQQAKRGIQKLMSTRGLLKTQAIAKIILLAISDVATRKAN